MAINSLFWVQDSSTSASEETFPCHICHWASPTQAGPRYQDEASRESVIVAPSHSPGATSLPPALPSQPWQAPISLGRCSTSRQGGDHLVLLTCYCTFQGEVSHWHSSLHSNSISTVKGNLNMCALWTVLCSFTIPCLKVQAKPDGVGVRQIQGTTRPVLFLSRGSLDQLLLKSTVTHPSHATDGNNCPEQHGESHSIVETW